AAPAAPPAVRVEPVIVGPSVCARVHAPPTFHVDPAPNLYYMVEVTTQPELFDAASHAALRSASNFYASWSDTPLLAGATYDLPPPAWTRLRLAERLWYRIGSSSSAVAYVNYLVSTRDDQGAT